MIFNKENTDDIPYKFTLRQEIPTVGGKHKHEMFAYNVVRFRTSEQSLFCICPLEILTVLMALSDS